MKGFGGALEGLFKMRVGSVDYVGWGMLSKSMTRQCLQSKRRNKLGRASGHHDVHGTILLRQFAGYISSFVRCNRSCHSEVDVHESGLIPHSGSRIFSNSALHWTAIWEISASFALALSVFNSRPSSWLMNSSVRLMASCLLSFR